MTDPPPPGPEQERVHRVGVWQGMKESELSHVSAMFPRLPRFLRYRRTTRGQNPTPTPRRRCSASTPSSPPDCYFQLSSWLVILIVDENKYSKWGERLTTWYGSVIILTKKTSGAEKQTHKLCIISGDHFHGTCNLSFKKGIQWRPANSEGYLGHYEYLAYISSLLDSLMFPSCSICFHLYFFVCHVFTATMCPLFAALQCLCTVRYKKEYFNIPTLLSRWRLSAVVMHLRCRLLLWEKCIAQKYLANVDWVHFFSFSLLMRQLVSSPH